MSDLFPAAPRFRAPRQWRMSLTDAGDSGCVMEPRGAFIACFECRRCGHEVLWVQVNTVAEDKRGLPCPVCNAVTA